MKSSRPDGLGHWPAGKRRSTIPAKERRALLARLKRAVRQKSARAVARRLGYSDSTIRRWLSGEDWPSAEDARRITLLLG